MESPVLSVCLITYNHAAYIRKTIDSILMQKVDCSWELIIADDFSTDGAREIMLEYKEKYPEFIRLIFRDHNVGAKVNWLELLGAAKGKYLAYVEGDDYWIDEMKLKKQVDMLEREPGCTIIWTNYLLLRNNELENVLFNVPFDNGRYKIDLQNVFMPYISMSVTSMFRKGIVNFNMLQELPYSKDNTLYVMALSHGYGYHLNEYTAVYRIHDGGVYSMTSDFYKTFTNYLNIKEIYKFFPETRKTNHFRIMKKGLLYNCYKSFFEEKKYRDFSNATVKGFLKEIPTFETVQIGLSTLKNMLKRVIAPVY